MIKISARRQIWGGLMPAAYPYVLMLSSNPGSCSGRFVGPQDQISSVGCGFAQPLNVNVPVFPNYGIPQVQNYPFNVFSQTDFKGAGTSSTNFSPPPLFSTTPSLFGPFDPGGHPDQGTGLRPVPVQGGRLAPRRQQHTRGPMMTCGKGGQRQRMPGRYPGFALAGPAG